MKYRKELLLFRVAGLFLLATPELMAAGRATGNYPAFQIGVTGVESKVEANTELFGMIDASMMQKGRFFAG